MNPNVKNPEQYKKPLTETIKIHIKGTTPLIVHRFSKKAREQMAAKQAGKAREKKPPKVPEEETLACLYTLDDENSYGFPAAAFKKAAVAACRQVDGIPMTVARGAFHVYGDGTNEDGIDLVKIEAQHGWKMRTDMVRLETGVADIRYRPEFREWETTLRVKFIRNSLSVEQILNLFSVAGFSVGVGENRAEKSGDTFGQWEATLWEVPT